MNLAQSHVKPHAASDEASFLAQIIETQNDVAAVELDSAMVMRIIVDRAEILTSAAGATLEIIKGEGIVCQCASGLAAGHLGIELPLNSSLSGACVSAGEAVYCRDTESDPRVHRTYSRQYGLRSMVAVPLQHLGAVVGVLKVVSEQVNGFDDRSIYALKLMSNFMGALLTHAKEFEIKQNLLAERTATIGACATAKNDSAVHAKTLRSAWRWWRWMAAGSR